MNIHEQTRFDTIYTNFLRDLKLQGKSATHEACQREAAHIQSTSDGVKQGGDCDTGKMSHLFCQPANKESNKKRLKTIS